MMKLDLDDLAVSSFEVETASVPAYGWVSTPTCLTECSDGSVITDYSCTACPEAPTGGM